MSRAGAHASGYLERMRLTAISAMAHRYERIMYRGLTGSCWFRKEIGIFAGIESRLENLRDSKRCGYRIFQAISSTRHGRSLCARG